MKLSSFFRGFCASALTVSLFSCGYHYTRHADTSLEQTQINPTTFAVFPFPKAVVKPPEGGPCMSSPKAAYTPKTAASRWDREVEKRITARFPSHTWHFLPYADTYLEIIAIAKEQSITTLVSTSQSASIEYQQFSENQQIAEKLQPLQDSLQATYAILFHDPSLAGEIQTNYSAGFGPGGAGFSGGSTKTFAGDVQIQVIEVATGKIVYNTGAWKETSGFCFVPAEEMAIINSSSDIINQLSKVIQVILSQYTPTNVAALSR